MADLKEDLKIVISGDPKKFENALDKVQEETKKLEAGLSAAAKISGVAFAALTGTVLGLVAAFREQEVQEQKVAQTLANTGNAAGMTAKQVFEYASALQQTSIYGDEVILESQNILLSMAKLSEDGFKKASQAALDLAAAMGGDLNGASTALGKALADPAQGIAALSRQGIKFSQEQQRTIKALAETGQTAKAQDIILEALEKRFGGMAAAQTKGTGALIQLKNAAGDVAEELGRQLTPAVAKVANALIPFFSALAGREDLLKTSAALLVIGTVLTGLVAAFALGGLAIVKWNNLMKAMEIANLAVSLSFRTLLGATGIGLAVIVITDLAVNWEKRTLQMSAAWNAFIVAVQQSASALNQIIYGLLSGDLSKASGGFTALLQSGKGFIENYNTAVDAGLAEIEARETQSQTNQLAAQEEGQKAKLSSLTLFLEQKKALEDEYDQLQAELGMTNTQVAALADQEAKNNLLEANKAFRAQQIADRMTDEQIMMQQEVEFQTAMLTMQNELHAAQLNAYNQAQLERQQAQQRAQLQELKDREKFGESYAKINKQINSEAVTGAAAAAGDLVQLQQSTNSTLKGIGKAAAVADIAIKTAQSAMNIYAGFSAIPFVGHALGIAGAAAAVAFGAERTAAVLAAADGGVMTGGVPGKDSIPTLTMPGEIVTPTKNYDEHINAVADRRLAERGFGDTSQGGQIMEFVLTFKDDAGKLLEELLNERRVLNI